MVKALWILILIFLFISCAKDTDPSGALNGGYAGTYYRSGDHKDSAYVQLVFVGSTYSGSNVGSGLTMCNGTYQVVADSINFINLCNSIPAEFLLLNGRYQLSSKGDSLFFKREYSTPAYTEIFSLKKN